VVALIRCYRIPNAQEDSMSRIKRFAVALLLVQPLIVSAGGAFAFSLVDGSSSAGMDIADPEAWSDDLSDHLSRMWSAPNPDYSDKLLLPDSTQDSATPPAAATQFPGRIGRQ
jgi:hypothetical protein